MAEIRRLELAQNSDGRAPLACILEALDERQRGRYQQLRAQLQGAVLEMRESPDGYGLHLRDDVATIMLAAEFVTLERMCCPFLDFRLEIPAARGTIWLWLSGREGVKDILRGELFKS